MKNKVLNRANQFSTFCFLDNHQYQIQPHSMECLLAIGEKRVIKASAGNALTQLQSFLDAKTGWAFGHLGYDLKNETENLSSSLFDGIQFPDLFFFEPEILVRLNEKEIIIEADEPEKVFVYISDGSP
ncbi:MAG TPA: hypothetical protein VET23_01815, partial [Chitinophagaceae bacterium]|nr:hypothetical protein [Chitinophagaceae bacterium]